MEKLEFEPCSENEEHLSRHTNSASLVVGSKVLSNTTREDIKQLSKRFDKAYAQMIEAEGNPGRQVFAIQADKAMGTDAVMPMDSITEPTKVFKMVREPGERGEATVNVVLIDKKDMPTTSVVHAVYGPYGPTGKGGIYTLMFGDPGEPFPRKLAEDAPEQAVQFNQRCTEYWNSHVFLMTPEECRFGIEEMKKAGLSTVIAEKQLDVFEKKGSQNPLKSKHFHSVKDPSAKDLGSIVLSCPVKQRSR